MTDLETTQNLFRQFPFLKSAHRTIRESRKRTYFEAGDGFARAWAQTLAITDGAELLSGTNLSALDRMFEEARTVARLEELYTALRTLTIPDNAESYLDPLVHVVPDSLNLEQAVEIHVAFLTHEGYKQLNHRSAELAQAWLRLWQRKIDEQNTQQVKHSAAALAPDTFYPDPIATFENAITAYLDEFGETGALSAAVLGAFPFSPLASRDLLAAVSELLAHFAPLFRLAQDIQFDPGENLNAGVYAVAAGGRMSAAEAHQQLLTDKTQRAALESRLSAYWIPYSDQIQSRIASALKKHEPEIMGPILGAFSNVLLKLAQKLTLPWKS